jgi:hypothetical protein
VWPKSVRLAIIGRIRVVRLANRADLPLVQTDIHWIQTQSPYAGGQDMSSQDDSERLDRLRSLRKAQEELLREFDREIQSTWQIYVGRFNVPLQLSSGDFSWIYVGLDIAAFAFGIVCIFLGHSWRELGVALIVGAMFGIGAFVGQLLSVQLTTEEHQKDLLWRDSLTQKYAAQLSKIDERISALGHEKE